MFLKIFVGLIYVVMAGFAILLGTALFQKKFRFVTGRIAFWLCMTSMVLIAFARF